MLEMGNKLRTSFPAKSAKRDKQPQKIHLHEQLCEPKAHKTDLMYSDLTSLKVGGNTYWSNKKNQCLWRSFPKHLILSRTSGMCSGGLAGEAQPLPGPVTQKWCHFQVTSRCFLKLAEAAHDENQKSPLNFLELAFKWAWVVFWGHRSPLQVWSGLECGWSRVSLGQVRRCLTCL